MEVNGHIYFEANLTSGNGSYIPTEQEAVWYQVRIGFFQEERKLFPLLQIEPRFFSLPARRPVNTGIMLYRIVIYLQQFIVNRRRII